MVGPFAAQAVEALLQPKPRGFARAQRQETSAAEGARADTVGHQVASGARANSQRATELVSGSARADTLHKRGAILVGKDKTGSGVWLWKSGAVVDENVVKGFGVVNHEIEYDL